MDRDPGWTGKQGAGGGGRGGGGRRTGMERTEGMRRKMVSNKDK